MQGAMSTEEESAEPDRFAADWKAPGAKGREQRAESSRADSIMAARPDTVQTAENERRDKQTEKQPAAREACREQ